jgi:two-component system sensor histidine kinase VanS
LTEKRKAFSGSALSRVIFARFFSTFIIYFISLIIAFFGGIYICSLFTWYGDELFYPVLQMIKKYPIPFLGFLLLSGFIIIFLFYWKKTLGYIDTIVEASDMLVAADESFIHLPAELRQVEDKMNQIKQNAARNARLAKEAEQRKNDLIVYLAHDLKTPLTSVIGYLTLLRDEQQISEELRTKYLSVSLEKAERLEELINEFFEITRYNLSQLTLEISRVNLSRMLEQIVYEFKPLFATKNLQCSLLIAPDIEIKCDVNKMQRVFDNLIRNAVNYSFENSLIDITVIQKQDGIYINFGNHGNTIPKEKLNSIFEQFFRLDTSRATKTGGAGLGLAIAKEIIELHHGNITDQ